ncbi:MAG: GldG family protein [Blautia sp.]|nr:GldG family protein [Blautia sp.]
MKKKDTTAISQWKKRNLKKGSYSLALSAVVVAITVLCNLIVANLPLKYREIDLSEQKLSTIGETTEELLKSLEQDITIYQMAENGKEDENVSKLLEKYSELSSRIKVEQVDPVTHPGAAAQYTDQEVTDNSLIVVSEERSKVVNYEDIYEYSMDYYSYSYNTTGFDGEGQITSAIAYVSSDALPIMYVVSGHGEGDFSEEMKDSVEKGNIEMQDLNLVTVESIPEDADCVMLFGPQKDISEEEAEKLIGYLEEGGKVFLVTSYSETDMPNIQKVLSNYGMKTKEGLVIEGNANYYAAGNPTYLIPEIGTSGALSGITSQNMFVLMPYAQAIEETEDKRDTITLDSLLTTSSDAYVKTDLTGTIEKSSEDDQGSFAVAMAATEAIGDEETRLVYISGESFFDEQVNAMVYGNNISVFSGMLSWMCDYEQSVSIPVKSLELSYLTVTAATSRLWGVVTVGIIPGVLILFGGVIWFRRRKG